MGSIEIYWKTIALPQKEVWYKSARFGHQWDGIILLQNRVYAN